MTPAPLSPKPVVDLTPFAIEPPQMGGQVVIKAVNCALAALGQPVQQFSLGIRRDDLGYLGRQRRYDVADGYAEWRRTEPVTVALFLLAAAARLPFVWAQFALSWRPWPALQQAVASCRALLVEMPWPYAPDTVPVPAGVPLIYLAQNVEYTLARAWAGRWAGWGDRLAGYVRRREAAILQRADLTLAISRADAEELVYGYDLRPETVQVLPRGLDLAQYRPLEAAVRRDARSALGIDQDTVIVFVGSRHGPNLAAARFFAQLAPRLPAGVRCVIAGSVSRLLTLREAAGVWLYRDDPRTVLPLADVAVNPMESGSGVNIKMLEYMAWGLPVITTPFGARGIEGRPGHHYVVAEQEATEAAILALLADSGLRSRLGQAGRRLVTECYSAQTTAIHLLHQIDEWYRQLKQ